MKLTPDNILSQLDRYVELRKLAEELDWYLITRTPHDIAKYVCVSYDLEPLEDALLEAGIYRHSAGEVITWARRKI